MKCQKCRKSLNFQFLCVFGGNKVVYDRISFDDEPVINASFFFSLWDIVHKNVFSTNTHWFHPIPTKTWVVHLNRCANHAGRIPQKTWSHGVQCSFWLEFEQLSLAGEVSLHHLKFGERVLEFSLWLQYSRKKVFFPQSN